MRNTLKALLLTAAALAAPLVLAAGPAIQWDLDDALKQVDRQSDDFKTALARVEMVRTKGTGEEVSRNNGTIFFDNRGNIRVDVDGDQPRTLLLTKSKLYIHYPQQKRVEEYSLSRHKGRLEPFLRLGFTTTGKDLKDDFLLTSMGERDIGDSRTLGLELTPENEKTRTVMGRAQLWIDQASWMPTQQVLSSTATGEILTVTYTHTARNLALNPDLFKAKWPRGTDKDKVK